MFSTTQAVEAPPQPPLDTTGVKEREEGKGNQEVETTQRGSHEPSLTTTAWSTGMSEKEQQLQQGHVNKWAQPDTQGSGKTAKLVSGAIPGPVTRRGSKSPKVIIDPMDGMTAAERKAEKPELAKEKTQLAKQTKELAAYAGKAVKVEAAGLEKEAKERVMNEATMKEKDQARRDAATRRTGEAATPVISYQMTWSNPDPLPDTGSASSSSSSSSSGAGPEDGGDQGYVGLAPAREGSELFDLLAASRVRDDANNAAEDLAAARGEPPTPPFDWDGVHRTRARY
jgi:hypothetical protein